MSDVFEKEVEEALQQYLEAVDEYNQLLPRVRQFVPGEKIISEKWDKESFKKLEEAEAKVTRMRQKWDDSLRRLQSGRQSP